MKRVRREIAVSLALLLAGIALTAAGVLRGEARVVLEKAIRICAECMGLG